MPAFVALIHGDLRTAAARRPQPDALCRFDGAGAHTGRAAHHGPPKPGRPAGRRHRGESEPRHRPSAFKPAIPPDGPGHQRGCRLSRLRHALGLRAGLSHVQGVADAAHPQDGRGGQHLPTRRLDVPWHRRTPVPGGVPPQGALRRHHHAPRRTQLRHSAPGPGPAAPVPLRPAEGHSGIRLLKPSRNRPGPRAQRVGGETDDDILRRPEHRRLLRRRGVQGSAGERGPSPLALHVVRDRQPVLLAEWRGLPQQSRRRASLPVAGAQACLHTQP